MTNVPVAGGGGQHRDRVALIRAWETLRPDWPFDDGHARAFVGGPGRARRSRDQIRAAKDTGLTNLPEDFDANRVWIEIAASAAELTAWMQMLSLADHPARRWEPKKLRLRLLSVAGRIARHATTYLRVRADLGPR